jgi:hypothetical protein
VDRRNRYGSRVADRDRCMAAAVQQMSAQKKKPANAAGLEEEY